MPKVQKRTNREARKPKQPPKAPIVLAPAGLATPNSPRASIAATGADRKKPRA